MKKSKIANILIIFLVIFGSISPVGSFARIANNCDDYCTNLDEPGIQLPKEDPGNPESKDLVCICSAFEDRNIEQIIARVIDIIFRFGLIFAPLFMIWGVFLAVTASGNAEQIGRAKNVIIWTLLGLVILLLSRGIVDLVENILGI